MIIHRQEDLGPEHDWYEYEAGDRVIVLRVGENHWDGKPRTGESLERARRIDATQKDWLEAEDCRVLKVMAERPGRPPSMASARLDVRYSPKGPPRDFLFRAVMPHPDTLANAKVVPWVDWTPYHMRPA